MSQQDYKSESELSFTTEPKVATFIRKTYNILDDNLFGEIVDWNEDGAAIVIKKPSEFSQKVLPKYFKHNHISSFIRQLNMYGFQKKRSRAAGHIYTHELFQKGQKHLLSQIKRKIKDNTIPSAPTPQSYQQEQPIPSPQIPMDASSLMCENEKLRGLKDDVYSKVDTLEKRLKDLIAQNQYLNNQLNQRKSKEASMMLYIAKLKQENQSAQPGRPIESKNDRMVPPSSVVSINKVMINNNRQPVNNLYEEKKEPLQLDNPFARIKAEGSGAERYMTGAQMSIGESNLKQMEGMNSMGNIFGTKISNFCSSPIFVKGQPNNEWNPYKVFRESESHYEPKSPAFIKLNPSFGLLGKRILSIGEDGKMYEDFAFDESVQKFLKNSSIDYKEPAPLLDFDELERTVPGFHSSWRFKEGDQRMESESDLLCFR